MKAAGWGVTKAPSVIKDGPNVVRSPKEIANTMAKAFKNKLENLVSNLGQSQLDPLELLKLANAKYNRTPRTTLELHEVTRTQVLKK